MGVRTSILSRIPSVDEILKTDAARVAVARFGRPRVVAAIRRGTDAARQASDTGDAPVPGPDAIAAAAQA